MGKRIDGQHWFPSRASPYSTIPIRFFFSFSSISLRSYDGPQWGKFHAKTPPESRLPVSRDAIWACRRPCPLETYEFFFFFFRLALTNLKIGEPPEPQEVI